MAGRRALHPAAPNLLGKLHYRPLGGDHAFPRVQSPIPTPAPSFQGDQTDYSQRSHKATGPQPGGIHPPGEEGHRDRRSSDTARWVLLSVFFSSKKRGWVSPYTGLTRAEQFSESIALSHAKDSRSAPGRRTAKLVHINRFKGCIFSRPDSTTSQAIPVLRIRRAGLPVQGPPIWVITSPTDLHKVHAGSARTNASHRNTNPPLSGRLAYLRSNPATGRAGHHSPPRPCGRVGSYSQLRQKLPNTQPTGIVPWHNPGLRPNACLPVSTAGRGHTPDPPAFSAGQEGTVQPFSQAVGNVDVSNVNSAIGPPSLAAVPSLDQWPPLRSKVARIQESQGVQSMPPGITTLETQGISCQRCRTRFDPLTPRSGGDRCFALWLGGSVAAQGSERALECAAQDTAHKCARAPCYLFSAPPIPAIFEGQTCSGTMRQQVSCLQCEPPRGHKVGSVITGCTATPCMGSPLLFPASGLCTFQGHRTRWQTFFHARNLRRGSGDSTQR